MSLTTDLKTEAQHLGFDLVGACPAVTPTGIHRFYEWISMGYGGEMSYISDRAKAYEHPTHVLAGVRSLLMLSMNYRTSTLPEAPDGSGKVSCYAWGNLDYHDVIHERLKKLVQFLKSRVPQSEARGVVDTAPLLEREYAQLAGLGWTGKNTLLIHPQRGSWFFLAAILTTEELEYDEPFTTDHCGRCTACLDACPTDAFPQPYVLDATQCISYLSIELRESIPSDLRRSMDNWVYGCDICQEVCPWNRHSQQSTQEAFEPRTDLAPLNLLTLFDLTEDEFRHLFRKTPLWRSKRRGILRNAAIVLGNQRNEAAIQPLTKGLSDPEPIVRSACAWALGEIGSSAAITSLQRHRQDNDLAVRREIEQALTRN